MYNSSFKILTKKIQLCLMTNHLWKSQVFRIMPSSQGILYRTSFAISGEVITTCLIEPTLMEKMGPYFSAQDVKVWCGFSFINCNKLPNTGSPGIATYKSSKPKHCNQCYMEDMDDIKLVDQEIAYVLCPCFSCMYYYCYLSRFYN